MKKLLAFGCLGAATLLGGAGAAQACGDDCCAPRARTAGYSYSYAPSTYGYTSWGYGPAYYYDDDYYAYGYGPSVGVSVYGDFDRRGRRFRHRSDFRDRGDRVRSTRVSGRFEGPRGMNRGPGRSGGEGLRAGGGGGGMMGGGGGGGRGGDGGRGR